MQIPPYVGAVASRQVSRNRFCRIYACAYERRKGLIDGFAKRYGLKRLVYMEFFERITDAIQRGSNMKHWPRAWKVRLILDTNLGWTDLFETLNN